MENLTKEDIQFLKDLGKELREQPHDGQASPRFWVVGDYKEVQVAEGYGEARFLMPQSNFATFDFEELREHLLDEYEECFTETQLEEIREIDESGFWCEDELLKFTRIADPDARIIYTKEQHVIKENTMFLTKQACKDHIKANHYHYTNRAHTYAMTAWRSPKVEKLLDILGRI